MEKKFVCPCGLTCCDCLFYKKEINDTAKKLKQLIKDSRLDVFLKLIIENAGWKAIAKHLGADEQQFYRLFKSFDKLPEFLTVLDSIIKLQCTSTCREADGCSIGGITHKCAALLCIEDKGYNGCWECSEFESCKNLKFLKANYGETIEGNLKIIKEKGIDAVKSRGDDYYEWQRRLGK